MSYNREERNANVILTKEPARVERRTSTQICDDEAAHTHDSDWTETGIRYNRKWKSRLSSEKSFDAANQFNYVGKRKRRGYGQKGKATQSKALWSQTTSTSVKNFIREQEVDTPQNPGHLGSL